ncbi:unnamed protein product [Cochlearia groenlandica]
MLQRPVPLEEMVRVFKTRHTTSYLFKIDNFSLLTKYQIKRVESSVFELCGHEWKLYVYPNGNESGDGHVSIFLENQTSINVSLNYHLVVISQLVQEWHPKGHRLFHASPPSHKKGFAKLISLEDLNTQGYLIEDCCMFGVKFLGFEPGQPGTAECFSLIEKPLNHKVTWMMTKFSSFNLEEMNYSNEFVVGNQKWKIGIYQNQSDVSKLSVFLWGGEVINNVPNTKTFAKFKLRVLDQIHRNHIEKTRSHWFDEKLEGIENMSGFHYFMSMDRLKEPYLVKDKIYVGVEFEVISTANYC